MRLLLRLISATVSTALAVIIITNLALTVPPLLGLSRYAQELSGSMRPVIPVGTVVVYRPISAAQLRPGMIIGFHRRGTDFTTTHRIVSVLRAGPVTTVLTKGDANRVRDQRPAVFRSGQTVWRAATVLPLWAGRIVADISGRGLRLAIGLIPLALATPWLELQLCGPRRTRLRRRRHLWLIPRRRRRLIDLHPPI